MSNTTAYDGPLGEHIAVAFISAIGFLLNSASLVVMLTNFTRIFSSVEACLVANLAVADLLTSLGGLLWGITGNVSYSLPAKQALFVILWTTVAASFLTLLCMGCERLLVVAKPLKAQRYFTNSLVYVWCGMVWFVAILTGSMIVVNDSVALFFMTIMFEVSLVATIVCYALIYRMVKRLRSDGDKTAAMYNAKTATMMSMATEPENESAIHHRVTVRQESRVTNMIFVLVVILALTVLPYMVLLQVNVSYMLFCPGCSERIILGSALNYIFPLEMANFMLNPVVYAWRLPKFRQASKKTFGRLICCSSLRQKVNINALAINSNSSDSGSLGNGRATIFTGGETGTEAPLNNNRHS